MVEPAKRNITIEAMEDDDKEQTTVVKSNSNFDSKNYLNIRLDTDKGEKSKELRIRLLPIDSEHDTPFKRIKMHNIKVPKEVAQSGYKSYVCLEKVEDIDHEKFGSKCPFCELNRSAYKKSIECKDAGDEVGYKRWQKISLGMIPMDVGILRCIERKHEEDGPKFWKFTIRADKTDPLNQIKSIYSKRLKESREEGMGDLNILDLDSGKDLMVTINAVLDKQTGEATNKTEPSIIDYGAIKPLTSDPELRDKWVNDEKVWSDVFVPKPYDFLSLLIDGEVPYFNKKEGKWVAKSSIDASYSAKRQDDTTAEDEAEKKILDNINKETAKPTVVEVVNEEDLPF